jgi:hypothetical protein
MQKPPGTRRPRQPRVAWALRLVATVSAAATTAAAIAHPHPDPLPQPQSFQTAHVAIQDLRAKRADGCPASFSSCSDLEPNFAFAAICCSTNYVCATDAAGSPACCPSGDVCTGTVPSTVETSHPATTAVSYVSNAYFPFPFAPTYFANHGDCSAAVSECSANYVACTSDLEGQGLSAATANGGNFAVTIVVPGGTTVIGGDVVATTSGHPATTGAITTYPTATATSICSSLSSEASCGSLSLSLCTLEATTVSGFGFGNAAPPAARAGPFGRAGLVGLAVAGVAGLGGL